MVWGPFGVYTKRMTSTPIHTDIRDDLARAALLDRIHDEISNTGGDQITVFGTVWTEDGIVGEREDIAYRLHSFAVNAFVGDTYGRGLTIDSAIAWTASAMIRIGYGYELDVPPSGDFEYPDSREYRLAMEWHEARAAGEI